MSAYQHSQDHAMIVSAAASDVDIARRSVSIGPERTKSAKSPNAPNCHAELRSATSAERRAFSQTRGRRKRRVSRALERAHTSLAHTRVREVFTDRFERSHALAPRLVDRVATFVHTPSSSFSRFDNELCALLATMLLSFVSRTAKRAGASDPNAAFDTLRRDIAVRVTVSPLS